MGANRYWKAVRGEGGRLDIVDWICPVCKRMVYADVGPARCPQCGLEVLETPISKEPRPRRERLWHYKTWIAQILDPEL
jgi:predicted amidophosphoribosyltransferase